MTVGVTKEWLAQQEAKASCPVVEGWKDGVLTVFVPGKPRNFKSAGSDSRNGLMKHRRLVKEWRRRTAEKLFQFRLPPRVSVLPGRIVAAPSWPWPWPDSAPKRVTLTVYSRNAFDGDGREVCCSPSRDALKDMRLVTDDRDSAGNVFAYGQVVTRKAGAVHGIAIRVERK